MHASWEEQMKADLRTELSDTIHPFNRETQKPEIYSPPRFTVAIVSLSTESLGRRNDQQGSEPPFYSFFAQNCGIKEQPGMGN